MNPTLLTALIAAAVSLVGVLASLVIAGRSARAAREQVALVEWLKDQRASIDRIRAYAVEVEKFRSSCWLLHMAAESVYRTERFDKKVMEAFIQEYEKIEETFEKYWGNWAEAKPDIPEANLGISRMIRHEARSRFKGIQAQFHYLQMELEHGKSESRQRRSPRDLQTTVEDIQNSITGLLELLDRQHALILDQMDMSSLALLTSTKIPKVRSFHKEMPNLTVERDAAKARHPSP